MLTSLRHPAIDREGAACRLIHSAIYHELNLIHTVRPQVEKSNACR